MATVLYLHGLYARPGGTKPTFLRGCGHAILNPYLPDDDFAESLRRARADFDVGRPEVVVGSSRGGAVALNIETGGVPVVLIAPAWRRWGDPHVRARPGTVILHSERDEVVPFADSRELVARSGLPPEALRAVGVDHNMVDEAAFAALRDEVQGAAERGSAGSPPP